jgi:sugar O-acyltransferase (sialic acid O-acetyltransferase NeuD family)
MSQLFIYGAGGFAREVGWLCEQVAAAGGATELVAFVDDDLEHVGRVLNSTPVRSLDYVVENYPGANFVVAVGTPQTREMLAGKAVAAGFRPASLVHPRTEMSRYVEVGEGSVICAGCILTTNIRLGRHVQINLDCTIGHDVCIGDFATLAPGVHISGNVLIGNGAYIGTGAVVINGTTNAPVLLGQGCIVGAGACVTRSVPDGTTVVGVPAGDIAKRERP